MTRVGITGQAGFIGSHLYHYLSLFQDRFELVPFRDEIFEDPGQMRDWVVRCDVIVHLAALNRHNDPNEIYRVNTGLVRDLIGAMESTGVTPHVLFSSSTQEDHDNLYGRSKKEGREMFSEWSARSGGLFTGLVIPNVFGPFGNPYYNSVVATFSHQLAHGETPRIEVDKPMKLIYVGELVELLSRFITVRKAGTEIRISHTSEHTVS
ncbi:MAG: NAD-dependent epimerase/dehydratase family protein, partial [Bacteroidetes bacterium]